MVARTGIDGGLAISALVGRWRLLRDTAAIAAMPFVGAAGCHTGHCQNVISSRLNRNKGLVIANGDVGWQVWRRIIRRRRNKVIAMFGWR